MSAAPAAPSVDLLPARMLNEFVYCPRLFFYEHVEGVFVHNADTKRGAAQHERVDSGRGALPESKAPPSGATESANPKEEQEAADEGRSTDQSAAGANAPANDPSSASETIHSRSVMLGSESLGVVAKLDLVEVTVETAALSEVGGNAGAKESCVRTIPVEYKAGAPREGEEGSELWDTDRIQLGLQMLLLRENGYVCDEGVVFYRETRQRLRFTLDAETEAWIHRMIAAARSCTAGFIPPPLAHSPKCPRCSLVPVCLPDETNLLRERPDAECLPVVAQLALPGLGVEAEAAIDTVVLADALGSDDPVWETLPEPRLPQPLAEGDVRRLIAPDIDAKALYVNTPGVSVTRKGDTVVVKEKGETLAEVRIKDLHHLAIFGSAQISTALVQTLCERDVPISYFSMGGWFYGLTRGHGLSNVFTRIRQFARAGDADQALPLARLFVYGKIRNQRTLLMRNHVEPPPLALRALKHAASAALTVGSHASLLGIEGAAAMHYFQHFGGMIKVAEEQDDLPGLQEAAAVPAGKPGGQTTFHVRLQDAQPPPTTRPGERTALDGLQPPCARLHDRGLCRGFRSRTSACSINRGSDGPHWRLI